MYLAMQLVERTLVDFRCFGRELGDQQDEIHRRDLGIYAKNKAASSV